MEFSQHLWWSRWVLLKHFLQGQAPWPLRLRSPALGPKPNIPPWNAASLKIHVIIHVMILFVHLIFHSICHSIVDLYWFMCSFSFYTMYGHMSTGLLEARNIKWRCHFKHRRGRRRLPWLTASQQLSDWRPVFSCGLMVYSYIKHEETTICEVSAGDLID